MNISHVYSGNPLNRGERERRDEEWISRMVQEPSTRFLLMKDLNVLVSNGSQGSLAWLSRAEVMPLEVKTPPLLLGLQDGTAHFVVDVAGYEPSAAGDNGASHEFVDVRTATELISDSESGIAAQARAQVDWHRRNGFCSTCGHETVIKRGGQVRHCPNCDATHYSRTDPVIISVVSTGDYCLLGRRSTAPSNRFSTLAGFVEQGESIEEAVAREVMEESGVLIKNVRYHSSQPWPFPSSLMIGCHADAVSTEITIDGEEMSDVRWFHRDEVLKALEGTSEILAVPGPIAIAHHIIKTWATQRS